MNKTISFLGLALATLALVAAPDAAEARQGRGRNRGGNADRVKERLDLTIDAASPVQPREARLVIRRRSADRQELTLKLEGAQTGFALDVLFESAQGEMVRVGSAGESRPGRYKWRVRTRKGQALPFGAADLSELSGRDVEVRTAAGVLVGSTTMPGVSAASTPNKSNARARSSLAAETADSSDDGPGDDSGMRARVRVRRRDNGREEFKVEIEGLASGLSLEVWIEDAFGVDALVGAMEQDDDDGSHAEYELKLRTDRGDTLPLGAASVADLGGLHVEIRSSAGEVLAGGTVPAIGEMGGTGEDDEDEDGDDENGDDENGDDEDDEDEGDEDEE